MAQTAHELDIDLNQIVSDGTAVRAKIKTANKEEYAFYARTYMWWREATQITEYLERCYDTRKIKYQARAAGVAWAPLLKMATDHQITATDVSLWTQSLDAIDADFKARPDHYAQDAVNSIVYFVESNGGKTGLAGYHGADTKTAKVPKQPLRSTYMLLDLDDHECDPAFLAEAVAYFTSISGHALPSDASLPLAASGFGLLLARQGSAGQEAVPLGNSTPFADKIITMAYRSSFDALPITMRSVVEPLHILNVPHAMAGTFDDYVENAELQDHDGNTSRRIPHKRFIYRPASQDFLLSYSQAPASVVVTAKPMTTVIKRSAGDLFLPPYVRTMVEIRLLYQRMFNLFTPSEEQQFAVVEDDDLRQGIVSLTPKKSIMDILTSRGSRDRIEEDTIRAWVSNIRHPALCFMPFSYEAKDLWQNDFKHKAFKASWRGSVSIGWLRRASEVFFDRWIAVYGGKAKRDANKVLAVELDDKSLTIRYEFGSDHGWGSTKQIVLDDGAAKGSAKFIARSTDLAFVLRQIADLNVEGVIEIEAGSDAMVLSFASGALSYKVYIPAASGKGIRIKNCFQRYEPMLSLVAERGDGDDIDDLRE